MAENVTDQNRNDKADMCVPCLICGTFTNLNEREIAAICFGKYPIKVCRECKRAVAFAKEQMKNNG